MAIFSFVQDDLEPTVLLAVTQESYSFGPEMLTISHAPARKLGDENVIRQAIDLDVVSLVDVTGGVRDARRPIRVISEQKQSFASFIQATHRRNPGPSFSLEGCISSRRPFSSDAVVTRPRGLFIIR